MWVASSLIGILFFLPATRLFLGYAADTRRISIISLSFCLFWLMTAAITFSDSSLNSVIRTCVLIYLLAMLITGLLAANSRTAYLQWRDDYWRQDESD